MWDIIWALEGLIFMLYISCVYAHRAHGEYIIYTAIFEIP